MQIRNHAKQDAEWQFHGDPLKGLGLPPPNILLFPNIVDFVYRG